MGNSLLKYLRFARDITISPFAFFRSMSVKEGVREAFYFLFFCLFLRIAERYMTAQKMGYFIIQQFKVAPTLTTGSFLFLLATPVIIMLVLYVQSLFMVRIGVFFGGVGNLEGSFKIISFPQFLSLFYFIPYLGIAFHFYAVFLLLAGLVIVFRVDWISAVLTAFFSWLFTFIVYMLVTIPPAYFSGMIFH